jgi:phenylalanyl-tRNA synthetase beta chain
MRISLGWLSELVPLPADAELCERLEMGGFEDVFVEQEGPDLSAVVVGQVQSCEPHPAADKLRVCSVDIGADEPNPIVCGAPNVAAGQKVAVALPGTRLPDGTKLKKAKIRGQVSLGMICSRQELGLGGDHDGIWVLPEDAPVGTPLPDAVATGVKIIEVGITPNRGDTASVLGLAREVRAFFGGDISMPPCDPPESGSPAQEAVKVEIDAGDACHLYVARIVRGVQVGPSPDWVVKRLEASGIRPINNVVDVTNLVLLELGQPLHAFDLDKLEGGVVRVRRATPGEQLMTLDGVERKLDPSDLLITDGSRPIALAGVMGGADSEVSDATCDVLLESAHFHPSSVRLTARRHALHSEASYRFERGVDGEGIVRAADRAATLLAELAGGQVAPGHAEARGEAPERPGQVTVDVVRSNRLLGTEISREEAASLLERVGIVSREAGATALLCEVPSHRNDIWLHQDLTEEIIRIYGYENIPTTMPTGVLVPAVPPPRWTLAERAKDALAAAGFAETFSMPFVSEAELAALGFPEDDPRSQALRLRNPIQEQDGLLRTTLIPTLLRLAHQNLSRQRERIRLFEVTQVFLSGGEGEYPQEPLSAAAVLAGETDPHLWGHSTPPPVFFEARGAAERLLSALGYVASLRRGKSPPHLHPGAHAEILLGKRSIGQVGELHPSVAAAFEIDVPCAIIELNLSAVLAEKKRENQFREVSREPAVQRDAAYLVGTDQEAGSMLAAIRKAGGSDLISVDIFDRYEGKGVPEGRVSLAFRVVFQRADRTLTDAEVSKSMDRIHRTMSDRFGAELR